MATRQGLSMTTSLVDGRKIKNIDDKILWNYGTVNPFMTFLNTIAGRSQITKTEKFTWQNRRGIPRDVTSAAATDSALVIGFATGQWQNLRKTDILQNVRTSEQVYVNETPSGSGTVNVSVTRGFAGSTAAAVNNADKWIRLGNAQAESSTMPDLIATDPDSEYNYVQEIRHPFGASDRAKAIGEAGGNIGPAEMEYLREDVFRDHQESKERTLLWGRRSINGTLTTTNGLIPQLQIANCGASITSTSGHKVTRKIFDDYLYGMFKYSSKDKVCLTGIELPTVVRDWGYEKLQINDKAKEFGLRISTYNSPHGDVHFINHPYFAEYGMSGTAVFFEPDCVQLRGLPGRMKSILDTGPAGRGIQGNDVHSTVFEYYCEIGLQVKQPERCGILSGILSTETTP